MAFLLTVVNVNLISKGACVEYYFIESLSVSHCHYFGAKKEQKFASKNDSHMTVTEFCEEKIPAEMDLISLFLLRSLARVLFDESAQALVSAD